MDFYCPFFNKNEIIYHQIFEKVFNIKDAMKQIDLFEYRESDLDVSQKISKIILENKNN